MLKQDLQRVMDASVAAGELAGVSMLLIKDGEEQCFLSSGYADIETAKPIARDSIFRLYSQSKPITAAATMMMMERGLIDLWDEVSLYLPGFKNQQVLEGGNLVPAKRPVSIMDLLGMVAGVSYPAADTAGRFAEDLFLRQQGMAYEDKWDTIAFCNEMGKLPLAFQPGTHFRYSTCADILGAVIEVASGQKYADFLRENIFEPLEMKDTAFYVPEEKRSRFVTCYERTRDGLIPFSGIHLDVGDYSRPPKFESGGAGLVSTLDDYSHFAAMLLNKGEWNGKRILQSATVDFMTKGQLDEITLHSDMWDHLCGHNYGKLMRVCEHPGRSCYLAREGEYGWDGWLGTYFANFPTEQMTLLVMLNLKNAGTTHTVRKIRNVLLSQM